MLCSMIGSQITPLCCRCIWHDAEGWHAFSDVCPHRLIPLTEGRISADGNLQCGYHGWEFEGSGSCVAIPQGGNPRNSRACAVAYQTAERQGESTVPCRLKHACETAQTVQLQPWCSMHHTSCCRPVVGEVAEGHRTTARHLRHSHPARVGRGLDRVWHVQGPAIRLQHPAGKSARCEPACW